MEKESGRDQWGQCEETEEGRKRAGYWSLFELPPMFHHKIHKLALYCKF